MIEITKDNYKDIDFNGVIISVPREHLKEELTQDFCLHFECAYYTKGEHGYKECGHLPSRSSFFSIWYGDEDMPNGFGFNSTSRLPWDEKYLHFNNVRYYKFKDMVEFCAWYLQQKDRELWIDDGENKRLVPNIGARISTNQNKEWIQEKCGTNTPPTSVPKQPSKGNKKSSLLDINELKIDGIAQGVLRGMIRDALKELTQKDKVEELNKINGESIYWDIYCEEETTPEMKEKIEELYPHFKEQYAKSIKQHDGENLKLYSPKEIRDKINPGWNTRRAQLQDVLKLLELRDRRQNTVDMLTKDYIQDPAKRDYLTKQLERDEKRIEDFLDEEVNDYFG